MSWKQGWFAVRASQEEAVRRLRAAEVHAPSDAIPESFRLGGSDAWTSFDIVGPYGHVYDWAQAVSGESAEAPGLVMGFFIFEGMWSWGCFANGEHIAAMTGSPHPYPMLLGDIPRAAELLGVPTELLSDYCVGHPYGDLDTAVYLDEYLAQPRRGLLEWVKSLFQGSDKRAQDMNQERAGMEKLEGFRVRDDDEFAPWDEYGFYDFAHRLGIWEPEIDELPCKARGGEGWNQSKLSDTEDVVFTFNPAAFRAQHLG